MDTPPQSQNRAAHEESADLRRLLPMTTEDESMSMGDMDILILKAVEGQLLNNVYIVGRNGAALGRHSASNDIVISESFVSRRHC